MSIASEITRISGNIADAYTSLNAKGATMPENQNSGNLADTIDTIQTDGGGGGTPVIRGNWHVPPEFVALDNEVLNYAETYPTYLITGVYLNKSYLQNNTYIINSNGAISNHKAFTINGEKTFTEYTSSSGHSDQYAITLSSDENWVIFMHSSNASGLVTFYPYYNFKDYIGQKWSTIYINVYTTSLSPLGVNDISTTFPNLKEIHPLENGCLSCSGSNIARMMGWSYIPSAAEYTWDLSNFDGYNLQKMGRIPNLPYGGDFSGYTTNAWNFTGSVTASGGAYLQNNPTLTQMYIKLPSVDITFNTKLGSGANWATLGVHLSADNWTYIAEHAPTVSSKTITINEYNANNLGATNKATLESKGWTVTIVS